MFRSIPIATGGEGDHDETNQLIHEYVNFAIETELRKYFHDPTGYDRVAIDQGDPYTHVAITSEELESVNKNKLIQASYLFSNVDVVGSEGIDLVACSWCDFIIRKFLQLVKSVKARNAYTPDLFGELLLMQIARHARANGRCEFVGRPKLLRLLKGRDDDMLVEYQIACRNLHGLAKMEFEYEIGWILWDTDYTYLFEEGNDKILTLMLGRPEYSEQYWKRMYHSVDYEVPEYVGLMLEIAREIDKQLPYIERQRQTTEWLFRQILGPQELTGQVKP